MREHDVEQGSDAWLKLRAGIPTASNFSKIITPTGRPSKSMDELVNRCIANMVEGPISETFAKSFWLERGILMEQEASDWYEFETDSIVRTCGFFTDDDFTRGATPDRIVMVDDKAVGGLEIKCPAPWTHIANILSGKIDSKYYPQVQGQMLIAELEWVDWLSYHPAYGGFIVRIEKDEEYQSRLSEMLDDFDRRKKEKIKILVDKGILSEYTSLGE